MGRAEQRVLPAGHVAADGADGDVAVAEDDAGADLDLEGHEGAELLLGEAADVGLAVLGVALQVVGHRGDGVVELGGGELEAGRVPAVELAAVAAHRVQAVRLDVEEHLGDDACRLGVALEEAVFAVLDDLHRRRSSVGARPIGGGLVGDASTTALDRGDERSTGAGWEHLPL